MFYIFSYMQLSIQKMFQEHYVVLFIMYVFILQGLLAFNLGSSYSTIPPLGWLLMDVLASVLIGPTLEELRFRSWLPKKGTQLALRQSAWFWAWAIHMVLYILPIFFLGRPIFDIGGIVATPISIAEHTFGVNLTSVSLGINTLINPVHLNGLVTFLVTYPIVRLVNKRKAIFVPSNKLWYVVSIISFVPSHFQIIWDFATFGSLWLLFIAANYVVAGIVFSLVYKKHGLKKAIILHGLVNIIAYSSALIRVLV